MAGKRAGMEKNTNTRSGLLWEVERILTELNLDSKNKLPKILLMENVKQVITAKGWEEWCVFLQKLGYSNYCQILNAKDYGIPQNRKRAFMISILGEYSYQFPQKIKLEKFLKDLLESNVDEKYNLSDKMLNGMLYTNFNSYKLENKLLFPKLEGKIQTLISPTIIARFDGCPICIAENISNNELEPKLIGGINEKKSNNNSQHYQQDRIYDATNDNISTNICTQANPYYLIKNATKKGFLKAEEGDAVDISGRMQYHRGTVQKGISLTLTTQPNVGVVVNDKNKNILQFLKDNNLRIRKLTPRECGRLMGVSDNDISKISTNQTNSSLYHLFGDSIVVDVLEMIFKQLL